jgi:hypothetical protein
VARSKVSTHVLRINSAAFFPGWCDSLDFTSADLDPVHLSYA